MKDGLAGSLGLDGPFLYNGQVWSSPGSQERACDAALADYIWVPACLVSATAGHVERILGRDQYTGKCSWRQEEVDECRAAGETREQRQGRETRAGKMDVSCDSRLNRTRHQHRAPRRAPHVLWPVAKRCYELPRYLCRFVHRQLLMRSTACHFLGR